MTVIRWTGRLIMVVIVFLLALSILGIVLFLIKNLFELIKYILKRFTILIKITRMESKCKKHKDDKMLCVHLAWKLLSISDLGTMCDSDDNNLLEAIKEYIGFRDEPLFEAAIEIISFGCLKEDIFGLWSFQFPESEEAVVENYGARTKEKALSVEEVPKEGDIRYIILIFDEDRAASSDSNMLLDASVVDEVSLEITALDSESQDTPVSDGELSDTTIWDRIRSIAAFVLGFIFATVAAQELAFRFTKGDNKFLFMESLTANKIAVWLLVFASVVMIIGKFNKSKVGEFCGICSGMGLFILYAQYCRSVETMKHYIIFLVVSFIVFIIAAIIFQAEKWHFSWYFCNISLTLLFYPLLFLVYAFLCKLIRLPGSFCLVVTSIVMLVISWGLAVYTESPDMPVSDMESSDISVSDSESLDMSVSDNKSSNISASDDESPDTSVSDDEQSDTTILSTVRSVAAFLSGLILAHVFYQNLAFRITSGSEQFLFMKSFTANKIAVWILIFTSVVMIIGKFGKSVFEKVCSLASGIGLFVLFVQYCRTVEEMKHYIIFSIFLFIGNLIIMILLYIVKEKWSCGSYFCNMGRVLVEYPVYFLVYAFFSRLIGIPNHFCLVVVSIMMFFESFSVMLEIKDE